MYTLHCFDSKRVIAGLVGARESRGHDCFPNFYITGVLQNNSTSLFDLYLDYNCLVETLEHLVKIDRLLLQKKQYFELFMINNFSCTLNNPNNCKDYRFITFG